MKTSTLIAGAILAAVTVPAPASAALLLGTTVQMLHYFPTANQADFQQDYTVGTSGPAEYAGIARSSAGDRSFAIDVFCGQGCSWTPADFNGFALKDTYGQVAAFTSVTINAATSYAGFDASRLSFDADTIRVNLAGLDANGTIRLDINAVPEPATWAMMIGGFGLAGATLRRRNAKLSFA